MLNHLCIYYSLTIISHFCALYRLIPIGYLSMNDLYDIATTYRIFSCDGEDSNLRSPAYETGKMTTSLPRNISFKQFLYG